MTVGETPCTHEPEEIAAYVLPQNKELNMVFNFELMDIDAGPSPNSNPPTTITTSTSDTEVLIPLTYRPWRLSRLKHIITKWQTYLRTAGFWNASYLSNHDHARCVSRFGDDSSAAWRRASAQLLATMQTTLGGTLFVYQGEEIGMGNFGKAWGVEEYKDVASVNYYNECVFFFPSPSAQMVE